MQNGHSIKIDLSESFEHLPSAPIVEAVIHWQARAEKALEPAALLKHLKDQLPQYPNHQRMQRFGVEGEIGPHGTSLHQSQSWYGYRLETADKRYVVQFMRDGLAFSRLDPYECWETFEAEAKHTSGESILNAPAPRTCSG